MYPRPLDAERRFGDLELQVNFPRPLHLGLGPRHFLHRFVGSDEGRPGRGPAGTIENPHLQAKALGFVHRVRNQFPPLVTGIFNRPFGNSLVRIPEGEAPQPDALHVLQVTGNRFPRNVTVHPVPPGVRLIFIGRILEALFQVIGFYCGSGRRTAAGHHDKNR